MSTTITALLGVAEAAKYVGIDPPLLRSYCRSGRVKAKKVARDWILTKDEADRLKRTYVFYGRVGKK